MYDPTHAAETAAAPEVEPPVRRRKGAIRLSTTLPAPAANLNEGNPGFTAAFLPRTNFRARQQGSHIT